jgi:hypothetical protein
MCLIYYIFRTRPQSCDASDIVNEGKVNNLKRLVKNELASLLKTHTESVEGGFTNVCSCNRTVTQVLFQGAKSDLPSERCSQRAFGPGSPCHDRLGRSITFQDLRELEWGRILSD